MAPAGARFVLLARREALLEEVADGVRSAGSEATVQVVDLRDHDAARAAAEQSLVEVGVPDVLVSGAGHSIARRVEAIVERPDTITRSVGANFTGPVAHALPLLGAMMDRGSGHFLPVTTVNARTSVPGWSAYVASKAGWDAWVRSVAPELRAAGVATSIMAYGLVDTPMVRPSRGSARRGAMPVDEAASWLARAVVQRPARVAPWWLRPYEVLHAAAPGLVSRVTGRFSMRLVDDD